MLKKNANVLKSLRISASCFFLYILIYSVSMQMKRPHSETALYCIAWMYHNLTPIKGPLSRS